MIMIPTPTTERFMLRTDRSNAKKASNAPNAVLLIHWTGADGNTLLSRKTQTRKHRRSFLCCMRKEVLASLQQRLSP